MGLDMYLKAKIYLSEYTDKEKRDKVRAIFPEIKDTGNLNSIEVSFEAGYWRKANQIHKWFVDNIQGGEDNCGSYYVSKDDLLELRKLCSEIIEKCPLIKGEIRNGLTFNNDSYVDNIEPGMIMTNEELAMELLPSQNGFFFGGTGYDEYYISDLKDTVEIIDRCLLLSDKYSFEYTSSW